MKKRKSTPLFDEVWYKQKRRSFTFYFILLVVIILVVAVALATYLTEVTSTLFSSELRENRFISLLVLVGYALVIGLILSLFISHFLILPIKKLQRAMNKVAEGDLEVSVMGASRFDEIDDLNHAFNVMMQQLRYTETLQSDFIANASHEFKTPLNAIEGYATLLQDENLSQEERNEFLEKIIFSSHKANELIANVLLLSKIDNQAIESKKVSFSADEQIRQAILFLEPKWTQKDISFDVELQDAKLYGNEPLTFHLWSNLISNAVKFSPSGSEIKITLEKGESFIIFEVCDKGPGIKEEEIKFLFNKFYQGDSSHKSEGNGLGLALVKRITDLYGGNIEVKNAQDCGAIFTVKLPFQAR